MAAVLEFCENLDLTGRLVYVIGEMLELGANGEKAHGDIGRVLLGSKADMIFLYGKETAVTASVLKASGGGTGSAARFFHTCDMDELSRALGAYVRAGDTVLLKGSRGCALERLTEIMGAS
jgi:UDP-N-acetylmuramoyl-tripeptide--D-alanyl-D-alanine ligase